MAKKNNEGFKTPVTEKSVYSLIGLTMRQGAVESGSFSTEKAVKCKAAKLVILAEDASDNTKKDFTDMCNYYHVPLCSFGSKDSLGHAIGKEFRVVMALTNPGLAERIYEMIQIIRENRMKD